ncbi:hypothetical protein [Alkalibacterium olivapovliticus]|uniref:DUF3221 domain-containing protein n=1 Tax=Alkalibacterium olivapovliticus TaxID=99907 RepID=A0A2T0W9M2_9LACT|nr:hypothetical protein [Alkalibacterium olivapovliticus]PRY83415.1 hypothetical protein CLV38_10421 [Alkalibacterium olivapovliticus]
MNRLVLLIGTLFLFSCQSEVDKLNQPDTESPDSNNQNDESTDVFTAEIMEINGDSAVVFAEDIEAYPSGANISISLPEEEEWQVGDVLRVEHNGFFMESDPLQIGQISVEKVD